MSSAAAATRRGAAARRLSLSATVLRLAAVAAIAGVLVWSVLFVDLLRKRTDADAALAQPAGQLASPNGGQLAQPPGAVTTRAS
jgi:hypothetical protein